MSSSPSTYDAVVIGAGHNGLVTALYLARAGWRVLVLEQGDQPGGAVRSAEITRPGFVHDLYATNLNLFLGSPVASELGTDLERHGLKFAGCSLPFANVFDGGRALRVHQGLEPTLASLERHHPGDAAGWRELDRLYEALSPTLFALYGSRLTGRRLATLAAEHLPRLGVTGARELARLLVSSTRELAETYMASPEAHALLACWGMHLDFGPDVSGGAMFPFLEAFTDMRTGIAIARGGASRLIDALISLGAEHGMELRGCCEVVRVITRDGRATGVELAGGEQVQARRAVVAGVGPRVLYERLLAGVSVPPAIATAARRYRYGPGTMVVHLATSSLPRWSAGADLSGFAYIHIGPYLDDLAATYAQASAGLLPAAPLLVVGQTSAVDPSRSSEGHVLWVQVRALPERIAGDAAGQIHAREWSQAAEPYADRVLGILERFAPGITESVLARRVLTPADLERSNPNLIGGDSISGSMHLRQNFLFRPFPEVSDYETGVPGLLMVGAATWPGAGVNAISGYNVAQKLLSPASGARREDARAAWGLARQAGGAVHGAAAQRLRRRSRPAA